MSDDLASTPANASNKIVPMEVASVEKDTAPKSAVVAIPIASVADEKLPILAHVSPRVEVEFKSPLKDRQLSSAASARRESEVEKANYHRKVKATLTPREKILFTLNTIYATLFLTALVLVAMGLLFVELFNPNEDWTHLDLINYVIMGIFAFETTTRLAMMGPKAYFTDFLCIIDFTVTLTDIVSIILVIVIGDNEDTKFVAIARTLRVARLGKITRIARLSVKVDEMENEERGESIVKDEDGHIYEYNTATLFSLGWLYNLSGTVLAMPEIWVQSLFFLILQTLFAAATCHHSCDPMSNAFDPTPELCPEDAFCINTLEPDYSLMFLGLAAFLLGIFAQLLFDRWWDTRLLIQQLFAEIKDTCMMSISFIRGKDEKSALIRRDVIRWSKLGAYLLEKEIDGKENFRDAVNNAYLKESEWDTIAKFEDGGAYTIPYQWGFDTVCRAADQNLCQEYGGTLDNLIMSFCKQRNLCSDILMILNTPMPYIFTHLMTLICKVNLLFTAVACGTLTGQAVKQEQWVTVSIAYLIVLLGNLLIEGLLRLHVVLSDPFGDDACDFPWQRYMDEVDYECKMMEDQTNAMPYDMESTYNKEPTLDDALPKEPPVSARTTLPPINQSSEVVTTIGGN